jgi:hypothetical protein
MAGWGKAAGRPALATSGAISLPASFACTRTGFGLTFHTPALFGAHGAPVPYQVMKCR